MEPLPGDHFFFDRPRNMMKALMLDADNRTAIVQPIPVPSPAPHEVLIRVIAVALNPVDALYVHNPLAQSGRVVGSDFAGIVEILGDGLPQSSSDLKHKDRVAGFLQGACSVNDRPGAFAEYIVCPLDLVWKVDKSMRLREAAAVSLCALTAAQALFFRMGLKAPFVWSAKASEPDRGDLTPISFFIYGASTSVGMYAAQLVRLSAKANGRRIVLFGAASRRHFAMLQAEPYGFEEMVDYHDEDWPLQVRRLTQSNKGVHYAYDCISEGLTVPKTAETLAAGGKLAVVRSREGGAWHDDGCLPVEPSYGAVWEGLGEEVLYQGMNLAANPSARNFAASFYRWLSSNNKSLEANPLREMHGGMESIVEDGFELLGSGTMGDRRSSSDKMKPLSAEKMVFLL